MTNFDDAPIITVKQASQDHRVNRILRALDEHNHDAVEDLLDDCGLADIARLLCLLHGVKSGNIQAILKHKDVKAALNDEVMYEILKANHDQKVVALEEARQVRWLMLALGIGLFICILHILHRSYILSLSGKAVAKHVCPEPHSALAGCRCDWRSFFGSS
jgi:hypothetical protein